MQAAVRPYLGAGVALVGAGAIALSPISPVVPSEIHLPSVHVSIPVELAAAVDPIQAYLDLVSNTVASISAQGQAFLEDPAPILQQILINQVARFGALGSALQTAGGELADNLATIVPEQLAEAAANLAAGNIVGVGQNLVNIIVQPVLPVAFTLLPALQDFISQPVANMLAVTQQFTTIGALVGIGLLEPIVTTIQSSAQAIQNVVDAVGAGDVVGAVNAIVAAPAIVANGFLNGTGADGGLLGPGLSTVSALLQVRQVIADAITPATPEPATTSGLAAANATTTSAATTVTLSTDPAATPQQSVKAAWKAAVAATTAKADSTEAKADASATGGTAASGAADTKADEDGTAKAETSTNDTTSKADTSANDSASNSDTSKASATKAGTGAKKTSATKKTSESKKDSGGSAKSGSEKAGKKK